MVETLETSTTLRNPLAKLGEEEGAPAGGVHRQFSLVFLQLHRKTVTYQEGKVTETMWVEQTKIVVLGDTFRHEPLHQHRGLMGFRAESRSD